MSLNMKNTKKYKAVIFDFHFTLAFFYPSREHIYCNILKRYGYIIDKEKLSIFISRTWSEYSDQELIEAFKSQTDEITMERWWYDFHSRVFSKFNLNEQGSIKTISQEIANLVYKDSTIYKLYPDVLSTLSLLKSKGIKIGIITNAHKSIITIIDKLGLKPFLDDIIVSCDVGLSKPNPEIFRLASHRLDVDLNDSLFIGDSYHTDTVGSIEAGCDSIVINRKDKASKNYEGNFLTINSLKEISSFLN